MDPAILSATSALIGSIVGGSASLATTWLSQRSQIRRELVLAEIRKREVLYSDYVTECTKLLIDAIDHSLDRPDIFLRALELLNRIRLVASAPVLAAGEELLKHIVQFYLQENVPISELRERLRAGTVTPPDPLIQFSAACREELRRFHGH